MIERINANPVTGLLMTFLMIGMFSISAKAVSAENCMTAYEVQRENNDKRFSQKQKDEDTEKAKQCWLKKVRNGEKDLHGAYLPGASFRSKNLMGVDFSNANLTDADFDHAYLQGAKLLEANLSGANLFRAKLNSYETKVNDVTKTFEPANLRGANLTNAKLEGARFQGTNLDSADLTGATGINDADFRKAKVSRRATKGLSISKWQELGARLVD